MEKVIREEIIVKANESAAWVPEGKAVHHSVVDVVVNVADARHFVIFVTFQPPHDY